MTDTNDGSSVADRLDAYQREHRWIGFPLAVFYKFFDDQGNYLAALITYYAFLSMFPMLLLASSVLGFVLQGNEDLQQQILNSTLSRFPVIGDEIKTPEGLRGSSVAVVIGLIGSIYGALGVAQATQNAMNIAWAVPRNRRPNPILLRVRSVLLLSFVGIAILGTTVFTGFASGLVTIGSDIEAGSRFVVLIGTILLNACVFAVLFRLATAHKHSFKDAAIGALFVATVWQLTQIIGAAYVTGFVQNSSSATNGVFLVVLGMIAWIFIGAVEVVFGVEINVVRAGKLYPRALLTPFTDNVDLTPADRLAYTRYAQGQRHKGFQSVSVEFDERARPAAKDDRESSG
ncbi:MAG: YihY/virulence factor BrkB family protein [Actinomycetota bacterium]|nr:YihY/virulence factor BrkB family protein [Actinomycetota bacterium]